MRRIFSKVRPEVLLHLVNRRRDISHSREDMCPEDSLIQMACFKLVCGQTFRPHKHIPKVVDQNGILTQESWIVIQGSVEAIFYDLDDQVIERVRLEAGDCSITLQGGHNYVSLESDTLVYEAKSGPYLGQAKDKEFIDNGNE